MRIVHLDTGGEFRGGQRQALLLARGLAGRGHAQVMLARRGGRLIEESRRVGMPCLPLGWPAWQREMRQAELIHAHDGRAHTLAALWAGGRPLVVSRRVGFPVGTGIFAQWKYGRATRFLAVSTFVKEQLAAARIAAEKILVVYDGVEMAAPAAAPAAGRLVLAPATNDPQKGSALAARACQEAGAELRFSSRLEEDLPQAALFLYLSNNEGLGSAILLAMARGIPVVASAVGGIPEIVEHQRTGLLVDNNPAAAAAAIRNTLEDRASALRRAELAHQLVQSRFTAAIMVAQTERAYEAALGITSAPVSRQAVETL